MTVLGVIIVLVIAGSVTWRMVDRESADTRIPIVFWGHPNLSDEIYTLVHEFENKNPQYRVVMGKSVAIDLTGDSQRLLSAIAGGVPPDVVWFDRFAIGEWAGRDALADLTPFLEAQKPEDPYRINLDEFYPWAVEEASYKPPRSTGKSRIYGVPTEADVRMLYANADILRQAGYVEKNGEPRLPKNWDELREYAKTLTRFKTPDDPKSGIARVGFAPNFGNSWLYLFAWQAGGEFLNPDRTRCTLDAAPNVRALRWMSEVYDDIGGYQQAEALKQTFGGGAVDPFITGQVAMKIDGSPSLDWVAFYRPDMDFVCAPPPMPQDQIDQGRGPISWSGGFALVIPSTSQQKEGAFKFIQYMYSWEAVQLMAQGLQEQKASEGKLYIPRGLSNRVYYERLMKQYVTDNTQIPPRFRQACDVVLKLMPHTRIRPVTPVGQMLWNQHRRAMDSGFAHEYRDEAQRTGADEYQLALAKAAPRVQRQLDEILAPPPPHEVRWRWYFALYGIAVASPFAAMYFFYRQRKKEFSYKPREVGAAMFFASPWLLGMIVFIAGPIIFSLVFSFTRYDVLSPARYVGFENYALMLRDPTFYKSVGNTVFMLMRVPLGMMVSLSLALILNRSMRGLGFYRTAFYLPAIMPLVAASLLWAWVLNPNFGALNTILNWIFSTAPVQWVQDALNIRLIPPLWLQDKNWSKPGMIVMSVWTAAGQIIIWLAGLQSIPPQLKEAASIDGAGAWKRFWNITIPMLSPYILFNAIIGVIHTMQIFQEAFIMTPRGEPVDSTMFYAYELFRQAFQFFRLGYASAMGWILFLLVLALTMIQLWLSKRWVHYDRS